MTIKYYNLYEFINDDKYIIYLKKIIKLTKQQFKIKFKKKQMHNLILSNSFIFIYIDDHNEKLIAFAFVNYSENELYYDTKQSTYLLLKNFNYNFVPKNLFPYINNFCRNPKSKYKGIGSELINFIFNYYSDEGYDYIYATVGSNMSLNMNYTDDNKCGLGLVNYNNKDSDFYRTNMKLLEYYFTLGFEIYENIYTLQICNNDNDYILFNVIRKKLKNKYLKITI